MFMGSKAWDGAYGWQWLREIWEIQPEARDVLVVAWLIWFEQNSVVHVGASWFAGGIIDRAVKMLEDYRAATECATIHGIPPLPAKWEPP